MNWRNNYIKKSRYTYIATLLLGNNGKIKVEISIWDKDSYVDDLALDGVKVRISTGGIDYLTISKNWYQRYVGLRASKDIIKSMNAGNGISLTTGPVPKILITGKNVEIHNSLSMELMS